MDYGYKSEICMQLVGRYAIRGVREYVSWLSLSKNNSGTSSKSKTDPEDNFEVTACDRIKPK